jgi:dimeric dUTPase (all-alpha-NTP-PPase superfamily)
MGEERTIQRHATLQRGDMLASIFERQVELRGLYMLNYERSAVIAGKESEIRLLTLAAMTELAELLQLHNWKPWKRAKKSVSPTAVLDELSDVVHFVFELAIVMGFNAQDIYNAYMAKADVNERRQNDGY